MIRGDEMKDRPQILGQPRAFKSSEDFYGWAKKYVKLCEKDGKLANIAGFCCYADICKDTFYECRNYYPYGFKKTNELFEDAAVNNSRTAMGIFYLKNKFGYADKQEVKHEVANIKKFFEED